MALERLRELIQQAAIPRIPRRPTKPTKGSARKDGWRINRNAASSKVYEAGLMSSEAQEERALRVKRPLPGRDESRHQLEAVASAAVTAAEPSTPAATGARLCGFASLTVSCRPSMSEPFNAVMAALASSAVDISHEAEAA